MSNQAEPSKLRTVITKIILCVIGVLALLMGLSVGTRPDATATYIVFALLESGFGLYLLFVAFFRSGGAAVRLLASFMDTE
jgi:hypothetical protein